MKKKIVVLPGDGIGSEVTREAVKTLDTIGKKYNHQFIYSYALIGAEAIRKTGSALPKETLDLCVESDAILFGAIGDPKFDNDPSAKIRPEHGLLELRKSLNLFVNIRPIIAYKSLVHLSPLKEEYLKQVDFVIYRELTGGIYFGKKEVNEDYTEASDLCVYTKDEIERIAHLAFKSARKRSNKLTLVDKANVLETSRLWRKIVQQVATVYPKVQVDYLFVDNAAMQIILNPKQFDVILTENMFGDILSDEASVIAGSIGLLPSASIGISTALFEPIHGSYPQAAGKDIANPFGSILSVALMMDYFGMTDEASKTREAIEFALVNGIVSKDLNPINFYSTTTLGEVVVDYIIEDYNYNKKNILLGKSTII